MSVIRCLIPGTAEGPVLASEIGLSFWGGVDPDNGLVIDAHHPLRGQKISGKILMLPTSRGSCSGSGVLLELIHNGHAPAALIFREPEEVLTLGALVSQKVFGAGVPVLRASPEVFARLAKAENAEVTGTHLKFLNEKHPMNAEAAAVAMTPEDLAMQRVAHGPATQLAMEILLHFAAIKGARELIDVRRAHIDGCILANSANLRFAETFRDMKARVRVPTTMNAISVEQDRWRAQGVPIGFGVPANTLAEAYIEMGAQRSFTCAPYLLEDAPQAGEEIGWSESNAVVYANTVLGARTEKHPDYLDLCIALTGRAPLSGVYLKENRTARKVINVCGIDHCDDSFWPMLGYLAGIHAPDAIPLIRGVDQLKPAKDDLKALCAAFGTTSGAPMLHVGGVTPEAASGAPDAPAIDLGPADFESVWDSFNTGSAKVDLVAFGSPHASSSECHALARALDGKRLSREVTGIVTLGRATLAAMRKDGTAATLEAAGVRLHADICWCSITEPVFPPTARVIMTNSGKYAHYAPGLSARAVRFGSLSDCVVALLSGEAPNRPPDWLAPISG
ncbi:DUF521 domain-containing protein [Roseibium hamelinense]|uniref:cis-3-hydroxy-L-proline dehydratase n=1 Tax=Roseibium hamelinense TaxID=150831 RepID=UPI0012BC73A0|nr:aconitase family protein [Roseibium hamelinense]MTI44204.1 DUF521 domain-containing protein [Roseibium hamelinense]